MSAFDRKFATMTRRDVLRVAGLSAAGAVLPQSARASDTDRALILLMLVGGPSQLETWDPKPDAPTEVRGPFPSIATAVPGIRISAHLPRLAKRLGRLTVVRSLHHDAAPIHETGLQLVQTGRLHRLGESEPPHVGAVAARLLGSRHGMPPFVVLPGPIGATGVAISQGQSAGVLGPEFGPVHDPDQRDAYGRSSFGRNCLRARQLVEAGVRVVVVNMFTTVFHQTTWDCHATGPFSTLDDYATQVLPTFDHAFAALLDDLDDHGLLDTTMVVATGEFGRAPRLNASGGRDHWPNVWSAALAGGGLAGGQVIGASDRHAAEPADRPVTPRELVATMFRGLDIDPVRALALGDVQAPGGTGSIG